MEETPTYPPKTFTVSEADALLPKVRPLIEQLQELQRSIAKTNEQLDEMVAKLAGGNGYPIHSVKDQIKTLTKHQLQLIETFQSALQQLEGLGCMLKDLNIGLIDFYGTRNGQPILLCWKMGEDRIQFWHPLEDGYAGRQPLE